MQIKYLGVIKLSGQVVVTIGSVTSAASTVDSILRFFFGSMEASKTCQHLASRAHGDPT